jgi:hypothetical protein
MHAACLGEWLRRLMDDPEMIRLVREAPQVVGLLRPLFRMLGQDREMPAILSLPKRARVARVRAPRAARPDAGRVRCAPPVAAAPEVAAVAAADRGPAPMHDTGRLGVPPIPGYSEPVARAGCWGREDVSKSR